MQVRDAALGHVVLNVANLKKSENFYRSIVGMKISARNRRTKMTFMSFGREHHRGLKKRSDGVMEYWSNGGSQK
jgi:catechol-2,3-dioxygenase